MCVRWSLCACVRERDRETDGRTDGRASGRVDELKDGGTDSGTDVGSDVPTLGHFMGSPLTALLGIYCWVV
jgi:hypothetical protein